MIRESRKRLGVTQKDLALTSGTGLRFIIELEKGKDSYERKGKEPITKQIPVICYKSVNNAQWPIGIISSISSRLCGRLQTMICRD